MTAARRAWRPTRAGCGVRGRPRLLRCGAHLAKVHAGGGVGERRVPDRPEPILLGAPPLAFVREVRRQQAAEQLRGRREGGAERRAQVPRDVRALARELRLPSRRVRLGDENHVVEGARLKELVDEEGQLGVRREEEDGHRARRLRAGGRGGHGRRGGAQQPTELE
eukprot:2642670-Prymnesium_polylepis.1